MTAIPVTIHCEKGLHTRVAAMVVQRAVELGRRAGVQFTLAKGTREVPADNLVALVSLRIRDQEQVTLKAAPVAADGPGAPPAGDAGGAAQAAHELARFLSHDLDSANPGPLLDDILHETTVTLEQVVDQIGTGLVVVDQRHAVTLINGPAATLLGLEREACLGRDCGEAVPGLDLTGPLRSGRPSPLQQLNLHGRWVAVTRTPILMDGQVIGAVATVQDTTELRRLAGELHEVRELKEHLKLVLETVGDGICTLDRHGRIKYVNPAYLALSGEPANELLYRPLPPDDPRQRALREGRTVSKLEHTAAGLQVVVDVHPLNLDGETQGAVAIMRSLSGVQAMADRLKHMTARAEYLEQELQRNRARDEALARVVGNSRALRKALSLAAKSADSGSTVLIRGESGTGKEVIARAVHEAGSRRGLPFIRVNCAAMPAGLVESELFGHEKGAFTGAVRSRPGKFELAGKGTIFLDEVGAMEPSTQAKLLRVLQEREFERVGGDRPLKAECRIIAATNAPLEAMMARGEFRSDLYYRLNVLEIHLPPLRDRREDIPLLAQHFVHKHNHNMGRAVAGLTRDCLAALIRYDWPGNVRELENVIERAMNLTEDEFIGSDDLPEYMAGGTPAGDGARLINPGGGGEVAPWEAYEREIIELAIRQHGSFSAAARALGLTHKTVAAKARRYGLV